METSGYWSISLFHPLVSISQFLFPVSLEGEKKKKSLRSKQSTSPFISKITTNNSHTPRLETFELPSVLLVYIGLITKLIRLFSWFLHLIFHHHSSGCFYSTHFSRLSLYTTSSLISLTLKQYNLISVTYCAICPSWYKEGSFKCAYT